MLMGHRDLFAGTSRTFTGFLPGMPGNGCMMNCVHSILPGAAFTLRLKFETIPKAINKRDRRQTFPADDPSAFSAHFVKINFYLK